MDNATTGVQRDSDLEFGFYRNYTLVPEIALSVMSVPRYRGVSNIGFGIFIVYVGLLIILIIVTIGGNQETCDRVLSG